MTPAASCPLTHGHGLLRIPVRGDYEAVLARKGDGWELRLGHDGAWQHHNLLLVPAGFDLDTQEAHAAYFHGEARIDGYRYGIRIERQDGVLTLLLLDGLVQPRFVTWEEIEAYAVARGAE